MTHPDSQEDQGEGPTSTMHQSVSAGGFEFSLPPLTGVARQSLVLAKQKPPMMEIAHIGSGEEARSKKAAQELLSLLLLRICSMQ